MAKTITPWTKIKAEYLAGVTPKDLSQKYKLTPKQISDKANKEKWTAVRAEISENVRESLQDKIKTLSTNALEVLSAVMNDPEAKDADKVSAARAIIDVSGLKTLKQEITGGIITANPIINILPVKPND